MKNCIWCRKSEPYESFNKKAHTLPQSLGGKNICENVCDNCNLFFGSYNEGNPPIETILKETFAISRAGMLSNFNQIGKNKILSRYKSNYFEIDWVKNTIKLKSEQKRKYLFSEKITRSLKRGLYKVILEEIERKNENALNDKYNFIREYSRYNLHELPVFYYRRIIALIPLSEEDIINPSIRIPEFKGADGYLISNDFYLEFEILGHVFGVPISKLWYLTVERYLNESYELKKNWFLPGKDIMNWIDIDLTLSVLKD